MPKSRQDRGRLPGENRSRSFVTAGTWLGTAGRALFPQAGDDLVAGNGVYPVALPGFIASVERLPRLAQLLEVPSHGVLNQLVRAASSFCYPTVYLCLYFGIIEVHVHGPEIRESPTRGNAKE